MEVNGLKYPVRVHDLSQEGIRIHLDAPIQVDPNAEVKIAVGKISPNVRGRVRWITSEAAEGGLVLGVQFESFVFEEPQDDDVQSLLDAWQEISHTYSVFESFLHILLSLDYEIIEGKIDDLSDVIYSITVWLDQRVGPLNLWSILPESDGRISPHLIASRHPRPPEEDDERQAHVRQVGEQELTGWFDGRPYLFGGDVVIEYLGDSEAQTDLLQRLAVVLSRRLQFWSKLIMLNISLKLLGEEMERLRDA